MGFVLCLLCKCEFPPLEQTSYNQESGWLLPKPPFDFLSQKREFIDFLAVT